MHGFLLEADPQHAAHVMDCLAATDIEFSHFSTADAFFDELAEATPQMIVLDWGSSDVDFFEVLRRLRGPLGLRIPIMMLTCVDSEDLVVSALDAGVDDILTKPVAPPILRARLQALVRRMAQAPVSCRGSLTFGSFCLDYAGQSVIDVDAPEERFALTPREFDLTWVLMHSPDRFVPRAELLATVWGRTRKVASHTLAQHVHSIRKKLGLARRGIRLVAVYGSGYRIESPVERLTHS